MIQEQRISTMAITISTVFLCVCRLRLLRGRINNLFVNNLVGFAGGQYDVVASIILNWQAAAASHHSVSLSLSHRCP